MNKIIILIITLSIGGFAFGQSTQQAQYPNLFAQGLLNIPASDMVEYEAEMRLNPNLEVVRLDRNSNRFFLLIVNLEEVTEQDLLSWFGPHASFVSCIQIGVHGVDQVNAFPFVNCSN